MKKNYEAPNFDVITYSLHEAIAGTCSITYEKLKSDDDFKEYNFVDEDTTCSIPLKTYCYLASTGSLVANS